MYHLFRLCRIQMYWKSLLNHTTSSFLSLWHTNDLRYLILTNLATLWEVLVRHGWLAAVRISLPVDWTFTPANVRLEYWSTAVLTVSVIEAVRYTCGCWLGTFTCVNIIHIYNKNKTIFTVFIMYSNLIINEYLICNLMSMLPPIWSISVPFSDSEPERVTFEIFLGKISDLQPLWATIIYID